MDSTLDPLEHSAAAAVISHTYVEQALRDAHQRGEFTLHYQPRICNKGWLAGVEALPHWNDSVVDRPLWLHVADQSGIIAALDEWTLRQACLQKAAWDGAGMASAIPGIAVSICLQLFRQKDFMNTLRQVLHKTAIAPRALEIELPASVFSHSSREAADKLQQLKSLGVRVAVSGLGSSYLSLAGLKHLPINAIKMDRTLIRSMDSNPNAVAVATNIIAMSQAQGYKVVADGVETLDQLAMLRLHGSDFYQGNIIHAPVMANELHEIAGRHFNRPPDY